MPDPSITNNPLAQLINQNTPFGNLPMADLAMPLLLKQMGIADPPSFSPNFARINYQNRARYITSNIMAVDPKLARANRTAYEDVVTQMFAGGADDVNALTKAREKAQKTVEAATVADKVGGLLGMDLGGRRFLEKLTGGVGNLETAAGDIVTATADRNRTSSAAKIRKLSKEVIGQLQEDVYEDDPTREGYKRLRSDFRKRLGGMNLDEYGQTFRILGREGALSRDTKTAMEQTKSMGGVLAAGKAVFGQDADPEIIMAAAREFAGSVKPQDANMIKEAFTNLAAVLDTTRQSAEEFFGKVQAVQDFARARGIGITAKQAGEIVSAQGYRTESLVNKGVDRTTAAFLANREAETRTAMLSSGGEQRMLAAAMIGGNDTDLTAKILAGDPSVDGKTMQSFGSVLQNLQNNPELAKTFKEQLMKDPKRAEALRKYESKKAFEQAKPFLTTLAAQANIDLNDQNAVVAFYDEVAAADTIEKQEAITAKRGLHKGLVADAYSTMYASNIKGEAFRAIKISRAMGEGTEEERVADNKSQVQQIKQSKRRVEEQRKLFNTIFSRNEPEKLARWIANKGAVDTEFDTIISPVEGLSDEENAKRKDRIKGLIQLHGALSNLDNDRLKEFNLTEDQAEEERQKIRSQMEEENFSADEEILGGLSRAVGTMAADDRVAVLRKYYTEQGFDKEKFKKDFAVPDNVAKTYDKIDTLDEEAAKAIPDAPAAPAAPAKAPTAAPPVPLPKSIQDVLKDGQLMPNVNVKRAVDDAVKAAEPTPYEYSANSDLSTKPANKPVGDKNAPVSEVKDNLVNNLKEFGAALSEYARKIRGFFEEGVKPAVDPNSITPVPKPDSVVPVQPDKAKEQNMDSSNKQKEIGTKEVHVTLNVDGNVLAKTVQQVGLDK